MRMIAAVAVVSVVAGLVVSADAAARTTFAGNVCGLVGTKQLKAGRVPSSCKNHAIGSRAYGSLGTLTAWVGLYGSGAHSLVVVVIKASNPSAVLAYLKAHEDTVLRQLAVKGVSSHSGVGRGERWFLAGGSYGVYAGLSDVGASKRVITKALSSIEAAVKSGI